MKKDGRGRSRTAASGRAGERGLTDDLSCRIITAIITRGSRCSSIQVPVVIPREAAAYWMRLRGHDGGIQGSALAARHASELSIVIALRK
jgi:hypothetical protein